VDKLERRGWVARRPVPADRRVVRVELTGPGRALIEAAFPGHAADIGRAMAALSSAELRELGALLRKLGRAAE